MQNYSINNKIFNLAASFPKTILALALLFSIVSILYTTEKMEFLTGRDDLMPRNAPFQVDYRAYRQEFGDQEEIAVVVESDDAAKATSCSDALFERLKREQGVFVEVFYPGGLPYFRKNGMLFMPLEDLRNLRKTLTNAAPVLKDLAAAPSIPTLFTSVTRQIDDYLNAPTPQKLESLVFMLSSLDTGFKGFDGKSGGISMDTFLKGSGDKPSMLESAGRQQVIAIRPVKETGSFVPAEKAILATRTAVNEILQRQEFKGVKIGLTGVPVLEYEEMATSQTDMKVATILSLTLTVVLLFFAFRGLLNVIAAMVSLIAGICVSFGAATLFVGHLNILSMVFAIMLIGLGIEYGIQVVLRYQEEINKGKDGRAAIQTSVVANIRSIILAAATTSIAFLTFVLTDFKGISELSIIAALGIVICVISTFTVLPAMMILLEPFRKGGQIKTSSTFRIAEYPVIRQIFANPKNVFYTTIALVLVCIYPLTKTGFDYNLMNLQPKGIQSVEYAYKLMRSKENSGYFAVVTANSQEEADRLTRKLEQLPSIDHVVSVNSLVPDQQEAKLLELAAITQVMTPVKPVPYEENLRPMELPSIFENFHVRVEKLKKHLEAENKAEAKPVAAFLVTLDGFFKSLEKEKDNNALGMLREFEDSMFAELPEKLRMLKETFNASAVKDADVPEQLKQRFIGKNGKLLLQVAPKKEIFEHQPLAEFVRDVKSVDPHATGEPIMVYESMTVLRDSYMKAFMYAFAGIVLILLLNFRSIRFAVIGSLPLAAGLFLMVGGMWISRLSFNSANIIVLPLILGVGIDSAIYIINRYRQGSETPAQVAVSSAGIGVFLNALTILFSFGALMVAKHQGVFSIGAVMSLGMTASVAVFMFFLPALLSLWGKR